MSLAYDLAIIGAGWAGINAAQEAKKQGLKVALIEKHKLGGTCLNLGCIPTKALIHCARTYRNIKKSSSFGIENTPAAVNFTEVQKRKEAVILALAKSLQFSLKGVDILNGQATLRSSQELSVNSDILRAKYIIIANGSAPQQLANLKFDGKKIVSSSLILGLNALPKRLLIIGGGAIGCEFASLFSTLGVEISIVELMPQLLPQEDEETAKKLQAAFKKRGIEVSTSTDFKTINLENYPMVLLSIGRKARLQGLGLERIGLHAEKAILTDDFMQTNIPNIFAAGDCTGGKMLAHYAAHQGLIAARNILKPKREKKTAPHLVPNCIFSDPEVASIGFSEAQADKAGIETKTNKIDFLASGMARILDEAEGFIKIVSDKKSGEILGASIIGPKATELISVISVAIYSRLKLEQLRNMIFAHPTLSESIPQACAD